MPLRQPPTERSFSLIPPKWNPVSNDRVLPRLGQSDSESECANALDFLTINIAGAECSNLQSEDRGTRSAEH